MKAVKNSTSLISLNISSNELTNDGISYVFKTLRGNESLNTL